MPSPVGHALAGLAIAWSGERLYRHAAPQVPAWRVALLCASLAVIPDLDFVYPSIHRTVTHSVTAAFVVVLVAACVMRGLSGGWQWKVALLLGLAYSSHMVLDWMGGDRKSPPGIQALWPFSREWFIAERPIFLAMERTRPLSPATMAVNLRAMLQELLWLLPVVAALWAWRRRASGV
jgi:membrane-bound metal-dependent hydrolase YbcI (DUF457 family)